MIATHVGAGGHRGWRTTLSVISKHFWWNKLGDDVREFVQFCLYCIATEPARTVPRRLGHALHADTSNEILHFDFCYINHGDNSLRYILVIKDDHSGYVWLVFVGDTTADTVETELVRWFSTFGVVTTWVSDW